MARVGRSAGTRAGSEEHGDGDAADLISRSAVRAVAWAGAGGLALAAALAIVALGGGDPEGPWSLAVTLLAVAGTSLLAVSLYVTVEAADAVDAGASTDPVRGTPSTPAPPPPAPESSS